MKIKIYKIPYVFFWQGSSEKIISLAINSHTDILKVFAGVRSSCFNMSHG